MKWSGINYYSYLEPWYNMQESIILFTVLDAFYTL